MVGRELSSGRQRALLVGLFFHFHSLNSTLDISAVAVILASSFLTLLYLHGAGMAALTQFLE